MFSMNSQFNTSNADLKVRSSDGTVFELHRAILAVNAPLFPLNASGSGNARVDVSENTTVNGHATTNSSANSSGWTNPNVSNSASPSTSTTSSTSGSGTGSASSEVIQLSEPANVLKICFEFVYPKRHPDLEDLTDFGLILDVANAVSKYGIFAGMNTCNAKLKIYLPAHATEILVYAIKYDFGKLMTEAIADLGRSTFLDVLRQVPESYTVPWAEYHEAWSVPFKKTVKRVKAIYSGGSLALQCHTSNNNFVSSVFGATPSVGCILGVSPNFPGICSTCRCSALYWISSLEDIKKIEDLKLTVDRVASGRMGVWESGGVWHPCCGVNGLGVPSPFSPFVTTPWTTSAATTMTGFVTPVASTATTTKTTTANGVTTDSDSSGSNLFSFAKPSSKANSPTTSDTQPVSSSSSSSAVPSPPTDFPGLFGQTSKPGNPSTSSNAATTSTTSAFNSMPVQIPLKTVNSNSIAAVQESRDAAPGGVSQPVCGHLVNVAKWLKEEFDAIPPFDTFLRRSGVGVGNEGAVKTGVVSRFRG